VEEWLGKVEEAMFVNLRKIVKLAISDFERKELEEWVTQHPSQVQLAGILFKPKPYWSA
jgi:dynein heavy chain